MNQLSAWQDARNILCIRLDHFGDVLMATPALRALKDAAPGRRLTLLAAPHGAIVAPFIAEIDDVIEYAPPWMKSSAAHDPSVDLRMIETLRARRFDAAVIFTTYSQSPLPAAMLCTLAGIPLKLAHCRENPYQLLSDWLPDPEPQKLIRHEVRRQLDLVAAVGARTPNERMSFAVKPADARWAHAQLAAIGVDAAKPWLLLHPGATAASRRYPPALWAQAASELAERTGYPLLWTGSAGEAPLIDDIMQLTHGGASAIRQHSLAGRLTLGQLGAVMSMASVVVVNNTGPAHLAAALGKPVVDLYALTNPQHTPWQTPARVLFQDVPCRFCYKSVCPQGHHACLANVSPNRVAQAAIDLLASAEQVSDMASACRLSSEQPLAASLPA